MNKRTIELVTWLGITKTEHEGIWTSLQTEVSAEYLPWGPNLPYSSPEFSCIGLKVAWANDLKAYHGDVRNASLENYECDYPLCPLCTHKKPVLIIYVRGLCDRSQYDRSYMYNIDDKGELVYQGTETSMIKFEKSDKK